MQATRRMRVGVDRAVAAGATAARTPAQDGVASGGARLVLCAVGGLPVADAAEGLPPRSMVQGYFYRWRGDAGPSSPVSKLLPRRLARS